MVKKRNSGRVPLAKQKEASPPASPVILVPATPNVQDRRTPLEDEQTPMPAAPPSPSSYAHVAGLPAARSNVVVWPLNPPVVLRSPSTPPGNQLCHGTGQEAATLQMQTETFALAEGRLAVSLNLLSE